MSRRTSPFARQWGWPIALAALTIVGLLSALIGEGGIWWGLGWVALTAPLLVAGRHILRSFRTRTGHARSRRA